MTGFMRRSHDGVYAPEPQWIYTAGVDGFGEQARGLNAGRVTPFAAGGR
jgi:hypothetical protein